MPLNLIPSWPFVTVISNAHRPAICRKLLSVSLSDVAPCSDSSFPFLARVPWKWCVFPVHPIIVHPVAGGPTAGGGTLDHLVKVLAARFLYCKANLRMLIELDIKWSLHKSQLLFRNQPSAIEMYIKGDFSINIYMDKEDNGLISIRLLNKSICRHLKKESAFPCSLQHYSR